MAIMVQFKLEGIYGNIFIKNISFNSLRPSDAYINNVNKLTSIGSDNGLLPGQRQAIILTNDGILLIGPLGKKFSEILIVIWKCHRENGDHFVSASMC